MDSPRGEPLSAIYASAQIASGNPPRSDAIYEIEYSLDRGKTWQALVKDWTIPRRGTEPGDFWSQSFCYGSAEISSSSTSGAQIRFRNNAGKKYLRAEACILYRTSSSDATRVTFNWRDESGSNTAGHVFASGQGAAWQLGTGKNVQTRWVEFAVIPQ